MRFPHLTLGGTKMAGAIHPGLSTRESFAAAVDKAEAGLQEAGSSIELLIRQVDSLRQKVAQLESVSPQSASKLPKRVFAPFDQNDSRIRSDDPLLQMEFITDAVYNLLDEENYLNDRIAKLEKISS